MMNRFVTVLLGGMVLAGGNALAANCADNLQPTTPTERFVVDAQAGVVRDLATGLMWTHCPVGYQWNATFLYCELNQDETQLFDWQAALAKAETTVLAKTGWRVPNIKELMSIVERACSDPAINEEVFPDTASSLPFWTSTPVETDSGGRDFNKIWAVDFLGGFALAADYGGQAYLRLVRDDDTAGAP